MRTLTQHSLRANIGIVQQDVFLFAGTIYDNIRYGRPDATEAEIVEAAKRALDGENVVGSALYFYAPALSQGTWINANRPYQQTIGCHRFYR